MIFVRTYFSSTVIRNKIQFLNKIIDNLAFKL